MGVCGPTNLLFYLPPPTKKNPYKFHVKCYQLLLSFWRATAYLLFPVRLLVCLSAVTRVDQSKTVEVRIMQLSPQSSSPIHLVLRYIKLNLEILTGSP